MDSIARIGRAEHLPLSARTWTGYRQPSAWPDDNLGVDVSAYQGAINFDALKARGVKFISIRLGLGGGLADNQFKRNWAEARRVGMIRQAYYVLYPGVDPLQHKNHLALLLDGDKGELPPALDVELYHNLPADNVSYAAERTLDLFSDYYGGAAFCYSAKWFIDRYVGVRAWFKDFWWWLAGYLYANPVTGYAAEHPGPVALPVGVPVERVLVHQTAGKYNAAGFGVESKCIDTDRWIRGLAHLRSFANLPESDPTIEQKVARLWAAHPELHKEA